MGIKVDHTPLEAVLALSKKAGKIQRVNEQIARDERVAGQIRGIQASKEMAEFNADLDIQKMKQVQVIQMQAEGRAQQWDIEKATLASQADLHVKNDNVMSHLISMRLLKNTLMNTLMILMRVNYSKQGLIILVGFKDVEPEVLF